MLEAVELPAGVAGLDAGLADVDGDNFTQRLGPYTSLRGGLTLSFIECQVGSHPQTLLQRVNDVAPYHRRGIAYEENE